MAKRISELDAAQTGTEADQGVVVQAGQTRRQTRTQLRTAILSAWQTFIRDFLTAANVGAARTAIGSAKSGANADITSLTGLTTPLSAAQGGTGVTNSTGTGSNVLSNGATLTGPLNTAPFQTIASAATVNLATSTADTILITGTTTVTSLGNMPAGTRRRLIFAGALTFTHNGTSLIIPGAANITTAGGDVAEVESIAASQWRVVDYTRASGQGIAPVAAASTEKTAWTSYTPSLAATSGTFTSATATGKSMVAFGICYWQAVITITTKGTGNTPIIGLPFPGLAGSNRMPILARESAVNGKSGSAVIDTGLTTATVVGADTTDLASANGCIIYINGEYPIA